MNDQVFAVGNDFLFERELYSDEEFKKAISNEHYAISVNIQLYQEYDDTFIYNYNDFLNSNCLLILLITDNKFVEIYSKNEKFLNIIYQIAVNKSFSDIEFIEKSDINNDFVF